MTERPEITPDTFEFAEPLTFHEAARLENALNGALSAMAYYGSSIEHITIISILFGRAKMDWAQAMSEVERERRNTVAAAGGENA